MQERMECMTACEARLAPAKRPSGVEPEGAWALRNGCRFFRQATAKKAVRALPRGGEIARTVTRGLTVRTLRPPAARTVEARALRLSFIILALVAVVIGGAARAADGPVYILVDVDRGTVLTDRGSDRVWQPASVTKLMTAYLTFRALKSGKLRLTSPVKISRNALAQAPSKMGYKVGTVLNVDNALKMLLVKSANDIAVALAETVGGSERDFVTMMNAEARRLGMRGTHYANPNGLPDNGQLTTARDMAVLARTLWVEFPEHRELFRIPAIRAGKRVLRSQNNLLERYRGANGMKTGFVCASGFNMVATATRGGRTMLAVVLGAGSSDDRAEVAAALLNKGFGDLLGSVGRPTLAAYKASPSSAPVANLRADVCKRNPNGDNEDSFDPVLAKLAPNSALGPRFELMAPVQVYTGRADSGAPKAVPLPRLRPPMIGSAAAAPGAGVARAATTIGPPMDLTR